MLGVSVLDTASKAKFAKKHGLDFPAPRRPRPRGRRALRRVEEEEHVRQDLHGRGADDVPDRPGRQGRRSGWDDVKVDGHAEAVLAAVARALSTPPPGSRRPRPWYIFWRARDSAPHHHRTTPHRRIVWRSRSVTGCPEGTLTEMIDTETPGCTIGPNNFPIADLAKGKRIVIFGLPGAFTPTCSAKHVPGYVANYEQAQGEEGRRGVVRLGQRRLRHGRVGPRTRRPRARCA